MSGVGGKSGLSSDKPRCRTLTRETWAAQDVRSAKAVFVPSLKRDIVPTIACTQPPTGGVAWQSTSNGENSYSHWAAQQLRGRSRHARSKGSGCGASASCCRQPRTMRKFNPGSGRSCRGSRNGAGSPDGIYGSKLGGLNSTPRTLANMRGRIGGAACRHQPPLQQQASER
jgi:hypothetical protein